MDVIKHKQVLSIHENKPNRIAEGKYFQLPNCNSTRSINHFYQIQLIFCLCIPVLFKLGEYTLCK